MVGTHEQMDRKHDCTYVDHNLSYLYIITLIKQYNIGEPVKSSNWLWSKWVVLLPFILNWLVLYFLALLFVHIIVGVVEPH